MLGAADVKALEYTGSGVQYQSGQSQTPGDRWPQFNVPSFTRVMSYETASMQDTVVRTQGENPPITWSWWKDPSTTSAPSPS